MFQSVASGPTTVSQRVSTTLDRRPPGPRPPRRDRTVASMPLRLEHLRPGAGAHAQPDRLSRYRMVPPSRRLRRARVRREGALQRLELDVDPRAVLIDEGRDVGSPCAQRRHDLHAARPDAEAQPPGPRAAPELIGDWRLDRAKLRVAMVVEALAETRRFRFGRGAGDHRRGPWRTR